MSLIAFDTKFGEEKKIKNSNNNSAYYVNNQNEN